MADIEPMEIDCIESGFEDKENSIHNSNVLPRTPCTEKGYEELDVSELNMKLRYSITPASSPNTKSFIGNYINKNTEVLDNKSVIENINVTQSLNSTLTSNENNKLNKLCPLQLLPTDQSNDSNRQVLLRRSFGGDIDNNITITVGENIDENLSLPSTSSSVTHTPEATTPTKELPKDGGSPIMRGLRSVLSMFRSSQSPIPPYDVGTQDNNIVESHLNNLDESMSHPTQVSTPIVNKTTRSSPANRNSPHKESLIFNDDLEKELLWKDETTILFKEEKIPIHKLFLQQSVASNLETKFLNKTKEELHKTVEYMDISYNDSVVHDKSIVDKTSKIEYSILESDSEFVDCESTYTNIDIECHSKTELNQVDNVNDIGHNSLNLRENHSSNVTTPVESINTNTMNCVNKLIKDENSKSLPNMSYDLSDEVNINLNKFLDENVDINGAKHIEDNIKNKSSNDFCNNNKTMKIESEYLSKENATISMASPSIASFENNNHKLINILPIDDKSMLYEHDQIEDASIIDSSNFKESKPELTIINPKNINTVTDLNIVKILKDDNIIRISDNDTATNVLNSSEVVKDKKILTDNINTSQINDDLVLCSNHEQDLKHKMNVISEILQNVVNNVSTKTIDEITHPMSSNLLFENSHEILEKDNLEKSLVIFNNIDETDTHKKNENEKICENRNVHDNNINIIINKQEFVVNMENELQEDVLNKPIITENINESNSSVKIKNSLSTDKYGEYKVVSSNILDSDEFKYVNLPTDIPLPNDNEFDDENAHIENHSNVTKETYPLNETLKRNKNHEKNSINIGEKLQNSLHITQTINESELSMEISDAELHYDSRDNKSFTNVLTFTEGPRISPNIIENSTSICLNTLHAENEMIIHNGMPEMENYMLQDTNVNLMDSSNSKDKTINPQEEINLEKNDEVVISENNSPFVLVSSKEIESVIYSENELLENKNPFDTDIQTGMSHPSPPLVNKIGYNDINFDDIDDPFTTKTIIRLSPSPDNSSETLFKPLHEIASKNRYSIQKKDQQKDKRKLQQEKKIANHRRNPLNNTFDNVLNENTTSDEESSLKDLNSENELLQPMIIRTLSMTESSFSQKFKENTTQSGLEKPVDNKNINQFFVENNRENETVNTMQPMIVELPNTDSFLLQQFNSLIQGTTQSQLEKLVDNKNNQLFEENSCENETINTMLPMIVDSLSKTESSLIHKVNLLMQDPTQSQLEKPVSNEKNSQFFEQNYCKDENICITKSKLNPSSEMKDVCHHHEITKATLEPSMDKLKTDISNITFSNKDTKIIALEPHEQSSEEMHDLESIQINNKHEKDSSLNVSIATCLLENIDRDSTRGVNTEDDDTIEGPFIESEDITEHHNLDYLVPVKDIEKFDDLPSAVYNDNEENGEIFIDAEAFEFLLNQNKSNVIADSGKESLFLKFDPLFAKRVSSDGIIAALKKVQNKQSTPKKLTKFPSEDNQNIPEPGPFKIESMFENENDDSNLQAISKPMMVVSPAVNSIVSPKKVTTPKVNRQSLTFTSPAMAVIDRLLSLSGNMTIIDQNTSISSPNRQHNETDVVITQLREMLAEKEIHVHNLRSETKELQIRLATMETQVKTLEVESEERLQKVKDLNERLVEKTKMNKSMAVVVEEYERTIASLILEMQQERKNNEEERMTLIKERDEQTAHLASMEVSFTDLHSKYEKSKQIILSLKANEDTYKKSIKEFEENLLKMQNNYELLKQHATSKLNHANQELEKYNRAHEAEVLKFNALIKRKELHITSLEETLTQKTKANEELTAICDELINKVG